MLTQVIMALLPSVGRLNSVLVLRYDHIRLRLTRPVDPFGQQQICFRLDQILLLVFAALNRDSHRLFALGGIM